MPQEDHVGQPIQMKVSLPAYEHLTFAEVGDESEGLVRHSFQTMCVYFLRLMYRTNVAAVHRQGRHSGIHWYYPCYYHRGEQS